MIKSKKRMQRRRPQRKLKSKRWIGRKSHEFASCKELYTIANLQSNTAYQDLEQQLATYARAKALAAQFQFFRMKYIKYRFISRYTTFQATTNEATAFPLPYLYYMVDKAGALPTNTGIAALKEMGAKPHKFIGTITTAYKPGVSIAASAQDNVAILATSYKVSPWLMTNRSPQQPVWQANVTDHRGLYWYLETIGGLPGDGTYSYDCEVEVVFEFKKPLSSYVNPNKPPVEATPVKTLAPWNADNDGVLPTH